MDHINYDKLLDEAESEVLEKYRRLGGGPRRDDHSYQESHLIHPVMPDIHVTVNPVINVVSKERQKNSPLSEVGRMFSSLLPAFLIKK